jgi:hypothetical protein
MLAILSFMKDEAVFEPEAIDAMSAAFDQICTTLELRDAPREREAIAIRIIELARRGERDPNRLCERVLREARGDREACA